MSRDNSHIDWGALAALHMHPIKLRIIEVLSQADEPLSASDLQPILGGETLVPKIDYHLKALASLGVIEVQKLQPGLRGMPRKPYRLVSSFLRPDGASCG